MKVEHILIPTDFSENSRQAVVAALGLRENHPVQLTLLHVIEPVVTFPSDPGFALLNSGVEANREAAVRGHLQALAATIDPGVRVNTVCLYGKPWREICDWAGQNNVDLIVIPTHGYSGLQHMWLGSVAERVVQRAPCPVLVVRAKN